MTDLSIQYVFIHTMKLKFTFAENWLRINSYVYAILFTISHQGERLLWRLPKQWLQ